MTATVEQLAARMVGIGFGGTDDLSADARASNFGVKTNFVQQRVGQLGVRFVF